MSDTEYDPSGNSNSSFHVVANILNYFECFHVYIVHAKIL